MSLRVVAQAVDSASLLVDNVSRCITIGNGVVLYVAFMTGCNDDVVRTAVAALTTTRIFLLGVDRSADEESKAQGGPRAKPSSLVESQTGDVLIIPQATMAGKAKGKLMQYHQQIAKDEGARLYTLFHDEISRMLLSQDLLATVADRRDANGCLSPEDEEKFASCVGDEKRLLRRVYAGTYGNRQGLRMDSAGPFTHTFEF